MPRTISSGGDSHGPANPAPLNPAELSPADAQAKRDKYEHLRTRSPQHRPRPATAVGATDRAVIPWWGGDDAELWDRVTINRRDFVGAVDVRNAEVGRKLDKRSARGSDGGRIVDGGYKLAEFETSLFVWTQEQLDDLEQLIAELHPRTRPSNRTACDIYHPALELLLIRRAVVESIGSLEDSGEPGIKKLVIKWVEYAPPSQTNVTQTVAAPNAGVFDQATQTALPQASDDANAIPDPSTDPANTQP